MNSRGVRMESRDQKHFFSNKIKMLSDSDEKKMTAALLSGQESAESLKTIIDPTFSAHVDTILHSFSTSLSFLASSSHQSNKKRKRYGEAEEGKGEERIHDSPTPVVDEGFSWRKYGQKIIKNSPHRRDYYRCSERNCNGRKHVQKIQDSPPIFRTTYVGLHMCQAEVSTHDNGGSTIIQFEQGSSDPINGEKTILVSGMNKGYSGDYDLLTDEKLWISDFDTLPLESDFDFNPFQG